MDDIIKSVLQDFAYLSDTQEKAMKILKTFLSVLVSTGIIQCFEVYSNGKWALGVKYTNKEGHKNYTYCVNIFWYPIEEKFQ